MASGGVHDNIADKIKNLNDALVPSFVFFLQQYQLRFVTTAPSCRSGASLSGSLPSPPLPSDSASLGASTSGESQLQGKVGKEQTLAAVEVLALVRELGRTYLATAKHLLDSDGGLCEEEETHEDKQQESTQRRITTIVAALKQVTNAASMIHRSLQPTRFHCGLSNSAPLTTVMNEEGILEIAAEVVEDTVRGEMNQAFAWLRKASLKHLAALRRAVVIDVDAFDRDHYSDDEEGGERNSSNDTYVGTTSKKKKTGQATDECSRRDQMPNVASQILDALDTVLLRVRPLVAMGSRLLNGAEDYFTGLVLNSAWLSLAWLTDTIEALCGVTARFDSIAIFTTQDGPGGEGSSSGGGATASLDVRVSHGLGITLISEQSDWSSSTTMPQGYESSTVTQNPFTPLDWGAAHKDPSTTDARANVSACPRFILVAGCLCRDFQTKLVPRVAVALRRFAAHVSEDHMDALEDRGDGISGAANVQQEAGLSYHKLEGAATEVEICRHVLAASHRLIAHFAEVCGSTLGAKIKTLLVAEVEETSRQMEGGVRPIFVDTVRVLESIARETAAVLAEDLDAASRGLSTEDIKRALEVTATLSSGPRIDSVGHALALDIHRVFDRHTRGGDDGVSFSVHSILFTICRHLFSSMLEGVRASTRYSAIANRQIQNDTRFLGSIISSFVDSSTSSNGRAIVDRMVDGVLVSSAWCSLGK